MAPEPLSIVVPARDEARVLGACLRSLQVQSYTGRVQVIVVANNCTDRTAAVARRFGDAYRQRGWELEVLELRLPERRQRSKPAALNAGESVAAFGHRVFLDADAALSPGALGVIARAFASGTLFCAPRVEARGGGYVSRAYGRVWSTLPCVTEDVIGAGVYAVHRDGRGRWGVFPDIISDDKFARLHFAPSERAVLHGASFQVRMPSGLRELVAVRGRWIRGNWELASAFPELAKGDKRRWPDAVRHIATTPTCWPDVPTVALVYACAAVYARRTRRTGTLRWERAERARTLALSE